MRRWISILLLMLAVPALAEKIEFQSQGLKWTRHVLTETHDDDYTLLLVIDTPPDSSYQSRVVFRHSYAHDEQSALVKAKQDYLNRFSLSSLSPGEKITTGGIWPIDHAWTTQDEADYSKWIRDDAKPDILGDSGIIADCAKFAITLRWIYAHDHHLPAGDQAAVDGRLIGSWASTADWDKLPVNDDWQKDERFKAALTYVLNATYTHSLFTDLYPVQVTTDYVKSGTIYLNLFEKSGHARTITNIGQSNLCDDYNACITIIYGNEPASASGFVGTFIPDYLTAAEGGLMRYRWPEQVNGTWQLRDPKQMPGYSTEQYDWGEGGYMDNLSNRLGLWQDPSNRYLNLGNLAVQSLAERVALTMRGYFECSLVRCTPGDVFDVTWSTPQRDHSLQAEIKAFQQTISQVSPYDQAVQEFQQEHSVPFLEGVNVTYMDLLTSDDATKFNGDPTVDIFSRWGITVTDPQSRLTALAATAYVNFQNRDFQVSQAQLLCFPGGGTVATCKHDDPAVTKLSTARVDQAFRVFQPMFIKEYGAANAQVQRVLKDFLQTQTTESQNCGGTCTMYDFLVASPQHLTSMSSDPAAPLNQRYGF